MKRIGSNLLLAFSTALLAACAPDLSKSTGDFSDGVSALTSASTSAKQRELQTHQTLYVARALVNHLALEPTAGCSGGHTTDVTTCFMADPGQLKAEKDAVAQVTLETAVRNSFNDPDKPPADNVAQVIANLDVPPVCRDQVTREVANGGPQQPAAKGEPPTEAAVLKALDDYAKGLAAVTKKSDVDEYKAAASKLGTTIGKLGTTIGTLAGGAGAAIGPVATAVSNIATTVYLHILEQRRFDALKSAVLAACIPIHNLAIAEGSVLVSNYQNANRHVDGVFTSIQQARRLTPAQSEKLESLGLQAAEDRRSEAPDPRAVADKLYKSHNELVIAVTSGTGETAALLTAIGDFATDAQALKDALQPKTAAGTIASK